MLKGTFRVYKMLKGTFRVHEMLERTSHVHEMLTCFGRTKARPIELHKKQSRNE